MFLPRESSLKISNLCWIFVLVLSNKLVVWTLNIIKVYKIGDLCVGSCLVQNHNLVYMESNWESSVQAKYVERNNL